jgi:NADH-quinone oxidoreductase subunit H
VSYFDPLFYQGLNWQVWLIVIIKVLVAMVALLVATALMIWFERKVISDMQSRIGPNRAGPWGLLQTLADGTKLIFKEDLLPDRADSFVFKLAPYLAVVPAVLIFSVVPVGGVITIGSHTFELQVSDRDPGGAGHVGHRRVRRDAGRLVLGVQVPAPRLGAGVGSGHLL